MCKKSCLYFSGQKPTNVAGMHLLNAEKNSSTVGSTTYRKCVSDV